MLLVLALVLTGMALLLSGCGQQEETEKKAAVVNGEVITEVEYQDMLTKARSYAESQSANMDAEQKKSYESNLPKMVLDDMIDERLVIQEAKKRGVTVAAEQVESRISSEKASVGGEERFRQILKDQLQMDEATYRKEVEKQELVRGLYQQVIVGIEATPEEAQAYYDANKVNMKTQEKVQARHILLATEEEAKAIIEQLNKGADFAKLAVEKSTDPSAKSNQGDLGFFDRSANLVPEFIEGAFALKTGEITQTPVKTQYGYHVIKVEKRQEPTDLPQDQALEQAAKEVQRQKQSAAFQKFLEELRSKGQIERFAA